jgi:hypothetical protein
MFLGCDFQSDMLIGGDKCILTCYNWYFKPIFGRFQQGVVGSFGWYLLIFANGMGWVQKCGYGWWLWLSKPWTIIKWSTFVWMLWLPQTLQCLARKWYPRFWTMPKETWWEVLWLPKLLRFTRDWKNVFMLLASSKLP